MSMKHRKFIIKLLLMPFSILASSSAIADVNGKPAPLIIQYFKLLQPGSPVQNLKL